MLSKTSVIKNGSSEEVWVIKQTVGGDGGDMLGGGESECACSILSITLTFWQCCLSDRSR